MEQVSTITAQESESKYFRDLTNLLSKLAVMKSNVGQAHLSRLVKWLMNEEKRSLIDMKIRNTSSITCAFPIQILQPRVTLSQGERLDAIRRFLKFDPAPGVNHSTASVLIYLCATILGHLPLSMRDDRKLVMEAVSQDGFALKFASDRLRGDKEVVLLALGQASPLPFTYASKELQNDRDFVLQLVTARPSIFEFLSDELKADREVVLRAVSARGYMIQYASPECMIDRQLLMIAISHDGLNLRHATDEMKKDKSVVMLALSTQIQAIRYVHTDLLSSDDDLALWAIERWAHALEFFPRFGNNKKILTQTVQQAGTTLQFASEELRNDRELVLLAVSQKGAALIYASATLKDDRELVAVAIEEDGESLNWASERLRGDRELLCRAIQKDYRAYGHTLTELKMDRSIVALALEKCARAILSAPLEVQLDRELVLMAMRREPIVVSCLHQEALAYWASDREMILAAIRHDASLLRMASPQLQDDRELVLEAVHRDGCALRYASPRLRADREMVLSAILQDGSALQYVSDNLKSDREVVLQALHRDYRAILHVGSGLRACSDIMGTFASYNYLIPSRVRAILQSEPEEGNTEPATRLLTSYMSIPTQ